jgi:protein-S-isoprenylcysteine O-methyltransferase Ste14
MNRTEALIGSAAFFIIAPGTVAGLIPWLITHWRQGDDASISLMITGATLILGGAAILIDSFIRFAFAEGTPAPIAPTKRLVVTGLYRFVRNPMYVGVTSIIFGQALLFANAALIAYAIVIWLAFHFFILGYEEPRLKRDHGEEYETYCANVHRWRPRFTPWRQPPAP